MNRQSNPVRKTLPLLLLLILCRGTVSAGATERLTYRNHKSSIILPDMGFVSDRFLFHLTLLKFGAAVQADKSVWLTWETDQVVDSIEFDIERSQDGVSWLTVGTVGSKGNAEPRSEYAFHDVASLEGTSYYRLRISDFYDRSEYSSVVSTQIERQEQVSISPNPTRDRINISVKRTSSIVTIRIMSPLGQIVSEHREDGSKGVTFIMDTQHFSPGNYVVLIDKGGVIVQAKTIVLAK